MLEQILSALQGLTAAIAANTAALAANPTPAKATRQRAETTAQTAGSTGQPTAVQTVQGATPTPAASAATTSAPSGDVAAKVAATLVGRNLTPEVVVQAQHAGISLSRVANEISRDAAIAIVAKFGAQAFGGVKPEDYAALKAMCDAALAPAPVQAAAGGLF